MIFAIIVFTITTIIYNTCIIAWAKRIPVSLSETSYILAGNGRSNLRYLFTLYCTIIAGCFFPCLLEILPSNYQFLSFLMCSGLLFSGFTPFFREDLEKTIHYTASITSFVTYIIFMFLMFKWWWILIYSIVVMGLIIWKKECFVYFAEMCAFLFMILFIIV